MRGYHPDWHNDTRYNDREKFLRIWTHKQTQMVVTVYRKKYVHTPGARCELDGPGMKGVVSGHTLKSLLVWWVTHRLEGGR